MIQKFEKVLIGEECGYFIRKFLNKYIIRLHNGGFIGLDKEPTTAQQFMEESDRVLDGVGYSKTARRLVEIRIMVRGFLAEENSWELREHKTFLDKFL